MSPSFGFLICEIGVPGLLWSIAVGTEWGNQCSVSHRAMPGLDVEGAVQGVSCLCSLT